MTQALISARDTRCLELGRDVLGKTPDIFRRFFNRRPALVVADINTFDAAGRAVRDALRRAGCKEREPFIFKEPDLHAEYQFVLALEAALTGHRAIPVAVGSGTINDLVKLAAHRTGRAYMVVATAASVDGYTAYGASITFKGSKQTFSCPAPTAVVADLDIIRHAPEGMNASGYADLLAKTTARADWLLSDVLGHEPIHPEAWRIVGGGLRDALARPAAVRKGDPEALRRLTEGLMLAGFAMQAAQNSRAASGAEHQFSHLWDMQHHTHRGTTPSHGFKVGIGTLAVAALYDRILAQPFETIDPDALSARWIKAAPTPRDLPRLFSHRELLAVAREETRAKAITISALKIELEKLRQLWPELKERLREQVPPMREIKAKLAAVGAPIEPEQIGISRRRLRNSFLQACLLRRRFTVLDLALRTDRLKPSLDWLFGPDGPWPIARRGIRARDRAGREI